MRSWRKHLYFRWMAFFLGAVQLLFPPMALAAGSPQIVTDGRTQTSLSVNGSVTDVRTSTVSGNTGLNSFRIFNVFRDNTVNLHLPDQTDNLVNMVTEQQTVIDGFLNAYKDGQIGGNVYFLNPYGVLVGESGVINTGSMRFMTPSHDFMNAMFGAGNVISAPQLQTVLDNGAPLSRTGVIDIRGQVNAVDQISVASGQLDITGQLTAGEQARVNIGSVVNMNTVPAGATGSVIDMQAVAPNISLYAVTDINLSGLVQADGADQKDAGVIAILAGENISVGSGAVISADGQGQNSSGGDIRVMAENRSDLAAGSRLSADGGTSGDGGFVEFSARNVVALSGGSLSASAQNGQQGTVLIDPAALEINADMLRNTGVTNGGTSSSDNGSSITWNAGSLILQADDNITVAQNVTISSRQVSNSANASAHRTGSSVGDSGDITLESQKIIVREGAMITAEGDSGFAGGDVTLDADSKTLAQIIIDNATIKGASIALEADSNHATISVYENPLGTAETDIQIVDGAVLLADDNISIETTALQDRPGYSGGILVAFDARKAISSIDIDNSSLTAGQDISIEGKTEINTDLSKQGFAALAALSPLDVGVAVTTSKSDVTIGGTSSLTSSSGDVSVTSEAVTKSTVYSESTSLAVGLSAGVSVIDNQANLNIRDNAQITADNVDLTSRTASQITTVADATAAPVAGLSGTMSVAVSVINDNTTTRLSDSSAVTAASDLDIVAESEVAALTAARAAPDDNFTATVQDKFDRGIDNTSQLDVEILGFNVGDFLKSTVAEVLTLITDSLTSDDEEEENKFQLGGALVFSDVKNNTIAEVTVDNASTATSAPTLTAGQGIDLAARGITQAQSFASGRTDNPTYGGQAGIGIQFVENRLIAQIEGADAANATIDADDLSVEAATTSYSGDYDNQSRFGVFASSGVGGGGDDDGGVGIAGAIALGINEVNETLAIVGDNTSLDLSGDLTITAVNDTEVKVVADGSSEAHSAADELFAVMMDDNSTSDTEDPEVSGGTLGIGASVAVATNKNVTRAKLASGAGFVGVNNPDNITVSADQTSTTETEGKAAGAGSISLVPLASVSVARNTAQAIIESGAAITAQGNISVSSQQTVKTSAIGDGEAAGTSDGKFALGIAAGVSVALDSNDASLNRDVTTSGGDVSVMASTMREIESGAKSNASFSSDDGGDGGDGGASSDNSTTDNATNNSTEDASSGLSSLMAGLTDDPDDDNGTYDFSEQMSVDTDSLSDGADLGSIGGDGEDEGSSKITIAAAMGVTYAESSARAQVADGVTINAGSGAVTIQSLSNTDMTADADASVSDGDYNIGGGIGLNIVQNDNEAVIGSGAAITSGDLSVEAGMRAELQDDNSTDDKNVISADAVAGAGTGSFSLAGSVGLNVVVRNNTTAVVNTDAVINAGGDVTVSAAAKNQYKTDAKATVGMDKTIWDGIDETFSTLTDIKVWTGALEKGFEGMLDNLQSSLTSDGDDGDGDGGDGGGDGGDGGGDDEGGTGIGAGISVNIIVAEDTKAAVEDNASLSSGGAIEVSASAESEIETNAFAGAKPDEAGGAAKTSLDAAVAVGVLLKDVDAYVGSGTGLSATDNVTISASTETNTLSTAKGEVSADSTAVGASVAVGVALETTEAKLSRDVTSSAGGVAVTASSASTDVSLADAVAAGTVVDKYADKLGKTPDMLTSQTSQLGDVNNGPSSMEALKGGFTGGDGASFDLGGGDTATGSTSGGEAQQSGSLNIAASVAVNWADHAAQAIVSDGVQITAADDVEISATNEANYRTRGSGMAVFADQAIGVGVGLLKTGQQTKALVGNNVNIDVTGGSGDVLISAISSENQGTDDEGTSYRSYASSEGIAGAGGGELGIAGSLSLVFSYDSSEASLGENVGITAPGDIDVTATSTNKIVNRAWAVAVASDVTCDNPGNCGSSSGDKTAVGASIAVNIVIDNNSAIIGEGATLTAGDNVTVMAKDLASGAGDFTLDPQDNTTSSEDYITTNYTVMLQDSSYYAEAIAGGAAQGGNAGSGSLAVTVSVGKTEAIVGEGVSIFADDVEISAYNESEARHLVGAVALSTDKKAIGASISGIYLREDVRTIVGDDGSTDDGDNTTITASSGNVDISAKADQDTLTFMAAGGVSGNDLALAGAFGFNVMDTDVEARVVEDALIQASAGSIDVSADSFTNIRNLALSIAGSGGSNSAGGSLALNMFLTDKKAIIGDSTTTDNNIVLNAANAVNIGVDAKQEILNGIISASVSTSSNALSGALSANIVKGETYALANRGTSINDNTTLNSASSTQSVDVIANDNTTITDLTGTLAASSSNSVGIALGANVFWKDVKAGIDGTVKADENVRVMADTVQSLTSLVVGIAGSTGGTTGAGSVGVGLVKSTTIAEIGTNADIYTSGSVQLHAGDDTDIFMMEPAASFSAGGNSLAGAVGAAVFVGQTKAQVKDGAIVTALGNTAVQVETAETQTSSPLLDGIMGGDDNQTRDTLGSFNDDFTFDNVKDLFLTERRVTETRRGVAVSAVADQDVISIAASGAVSSSSAIAVSLSAGVGVGQVEASIGDADINSGSGTANAGQDVVVRALSDTYWTDVSGAIAVGTGSAGVGIGGDIVVQVKDTRAFIAQGADVTAANDVVVHANNSDRIINSAVSVGGGSSAGVSGAAAIGVVVNTTKAYIDGEVDAGSDLTVKAGSKAEHIQIAGGIGAGGTAGIGASFGIGFVKNETEAYIDENAVTNASDNTSVTADTTENAVTAVIAGGVGGTVGVSVSAGIKVHMSNTRAYIKGQVNQDDNFTSATQDVNVAAVNRINTIDVVGGIGGGGTVGVGVTLNALVVYNNAQAWIGGGPNTLVTAGRDVSVTATSAKSTKNFLLAGAAGGTVAVGGNIAVLLVGAQADDEAAGQMNSSDHGDIAGASDDRTQGIQLGNTISPDNSSGDYAATGFDFAELNSAIDDNNSAHGQIGNTFVSQDSGLSRNKTQAFIENGAVVRAGEDLSIEAEDTTNTIFAAAAINGAGVVGVGATIGILLVNNTAEAYIGRNAVVNVEGDLLIRSRTSEVVGSGALSAGGAGVASVQGTIMAQATKSKSRAFIQDNAVVNDNTTEASTQSVAVLAESDTDLVSVSGSGGGAIVGVGITGDVMILEKETKAYIDDNATVRSGGDVSVDAVAQADLIQVALSINGGVVGVTGAAGTAVANNLTQARIGRDATVYAGDSMRVQATDDTEIDAVVITGAGGVVGVSGSVGTYVAKSTTEAKIEDGAIINALASGDGISALSGTVDNSTIAVASLTTRDQEDNETSTDFDQVDASFNTTNKFGLQVAAVTYEDMNFAPVGVAGGVVGVAGVVATTVTNSTTRAIIEDNTNINTTGDNSGAGVNQSVELLAASESQLNNISSGVGVGAVGVTFDIDTQVFKKTVEARLLGDATAKRNVTVEAEARDRVFQTAVTIAGGAVGVGGIVEVSVVSDTVKAEIGDNSTITAGEDVLVSATSDLNMYQTAGNVAAGGVGVGASIGILVAKSETTARIGNGANVHAEDNLTVVATSDTDLHQNIMGFSGGGVGVTGSLGINVLKNTTLAEIGSNAQINQMAEDNRSTQSVNVLARDNLVTQGASGAAAVGAAAGVGMGLTVTALRASTQAVVGNNTVISARDDVTVDATSTKNINNTVISFGGGGSVGASGSVALTIVGGAMSGDSGDYLEDDNGNMIAAAEADATQDRNAGDNETAVGNDGNSRQTSAKSNQLYADQYDQEASTLAENESGGLQTDVEGASNQSTLASVGSNAVITAGDDLTVRASDETTLGTNAGGGGAGGAAGVGVTMGMMFNNAITEARIGTGAQIDATEATLIEARSVESVNKFGMTGGGGGVSVQATAMVNVSQTQTTASIGDNALVNQNDNSSTSQSVAVKARSTSEMIAVSGSGGGGAIGAGVSGDAMVLEKQTTASIGAGAQVSAQGDISVDAEAQADLLQLALSVNGGIVGVTGAAGIGVVNNRTRAAVNDNAVIFAHDSMRIHASDDTEIDAVAVAGAVGGVAGASGAIGVYVVKSSTESLIGENADVTALGSGDGIAAYTGSVDNSTTNIVTKTRVEQDGTEVQDNYTVVDATFGTATQRGLSMSAVTSEDITFAPIGAAGGGTAGLSGVIATTVANSTTRTQIGNGTTVNQANDGADAAQDVTVVAASDTRLNNISAAIGIGALGAAFDLDTQVYKKTVEARILGDVTAERDVLVKADTTDGVMQTAASAAGGVGAVGGLAAISVVSNTVKAEIGDNSTTLAGEDVDVLANQRVEMLQTAGNVAAGGVAAGASVGVLYAKANNTARIGNGASVSAGDNITVAADTDIDMNQNVIGGAGGALAAVSGSVGFNMLTNTTVAEIGDGAQINQQAGYDNLTTVQGVSVTATETVNTQGAAGAAAIGGAAGVGIGVAVTVNRGSVKARIGNNVNVSAEEDVVVLADSTKTLSNQGIAFGGGIGLGAAGSVALTMIGGSMSDNASDSLNNDGGNMVAQSSGSVGQDRQGNDGESETGKGRLSSYTGAHDNQTNSLVMAETSGMQGDVEGSGASSTLAEIGSNTVIRTSGAVQVEAEETLNLSQIAGGASVGLVGVGGFVAVADYDGSVTARIGDGTTIDNASALTVDATLNSGPNLNIALPNSQNLQVAAVNSTVIGASVGIAGLAASIAQVNLDENVTASIGNNVTVTLQDNSSAVSVDALRDVDADVNVAAVAGGVVAAGVSYAGVDASGDARAQIGNNVSIGSNTDRLGDITIRARNQSTQDTSATSAGGAFTGALVGAIVNLGDAGSTVASVGSNTNIYSIGAVNVLADDKARNNSDAVGVAIAGGVGLSIISSDVDVDRDARVSIGDGAQLTGASLNLTANIGEAGQNMATSDVTGASGGILVGVSGSESFVDVDANAQVLVGNSVQLNVNRSDAAADNLTVMATNNTNQLNEIDAFAFGAAAIGAHVSRSNQTGGTLVQFGYDVDVDAKNSATIQAISDRSALTDNVAGAGGALAAVGGEAGTNAIATDQIIFADAANSTNRSQIAVGDDLTLRAYNNDNYDSRINASAIGAAAVTGGKAESVGVSTTKVRIGDFTEIDSHQLNLTSENNFTKDGYTGENFNFSGGGGITVTLGYAEATQTQNSLVEFGENSDVYVAGNAASEGNANIRALSYGRMDTGSKVSTGGFVSIPQSQARNTGYQNTNIIFEGNARLETQRGDIDARTIADTNINSRAKTSVWGLAGAGASGKSYGTVTSNEGFTVKSGSSVIANGFMYMYAGSDIAPSQVGVVAKSDVYNRTALPITTGLVADARGTHNSRLDIQSGASVKSGRHLRLRARKADMNLNGDGHHQFLVLGIPADDSFGDETANSTGIVNIDGTVETGVYNRQFIGFSKTFGNMVANTTTPGDLTDVARQVLVYDEANGTWERRSIDNSSSLGTINVATGNWSNADSITVKSGEEMSWTFDTDRSLAQDIDAEIQELNDALAASYSSAGKTLIQNQINDIDDMISDINDGTIVMEAAASSYSDAINGFDSGIQDMTNNINALPADQSTWSSGQQANFTLWDDNRTTMQTARAELVAAGPNNFQPNDVVIAELNAKKVQLQASIIDGAPADIKAAINTEIAFLNAKKAQLNQGAVDVIQVDELFASTGHVLIEGGALTGSSSGTITSKNDVEIFVRNSSTNPMELLDVTIPNDPGGTIYFNEQVVRNVADVQRLNEGSQNVGFTMNSDPGNFNPQVIIDSKFDASAPGFNPNNLNLKSPELLLNGQIENRGGLVKVTNKTGSIFQTATINAGELKMTAGGSLFISNKGNGITNLGTHPDYGFSSYVNPRVNSPGLGSTGWDSLGGCGGANDRTIACNQANASGQPQFIGTDYVLAGEKIFVVANTVNLNGLIQSGIAEKNITINDFTTLTGTALFNVFKNDLDSDGDDVLDGNEWTDLNGNGQFDVADLANSDALAFDPTSSYVTGTEATFSGSGLSREMRGLSDAYYDPSDDSVYVSNLEAKGGEIFIGGKLISTGNGQINVLDGYGRFDINNQSGKDIVLSSVDTGEVEGKITLIDNFKVDSNNVTKITQFTREGGDIQVFEGFGNPTTDVSGSYYQASYGGDNDRVTRYNPKANARYHWMQGEYAEQVIPWTVVKTTFGFPGWDWFSSSAFEVAPADMQPAAMSPSELPNADYATISPGVSDDLRMTYRYEQTYYTNTLGTKNKSCKGFILYKCTLTVNGTIEDRGNHYYYFDAKADRSVDIRFIGSDEGRINVNSNAGIRVAGDINNRTGTTTLTAVDDIAVTNDRSIVDVATLVLDTGGSIGDDNTSLRLIQGTADTIDVTANGGVFIESREGNLNFVNLTNTGDGTVDLYAGENISLTTATTALRGGDITMKAKYGSLTDVSGNAIRIDSQATGALSAYSRTGEIDIVEVAGDLRVKQIDSISNVTLSTTNGSILDGNDEQTDDVTTQAALLALWNELSLTGQRAEDKKTAQIASFNNEMNDLYRDYNELRNITEVSPGVYIREVYDPNFTYTASADERAALNNDAGAIAAFEARQQARYQQGFEKFGNNPYDPNYSHAITAEEEAVLTAGYKWEEHELEVPLPGQAFKEVTDTTAFIETPNIIGDNITLSIQGGNIGIFEAPEQYDIDLIRAGTLDNASKIKLAAAEADDVFVNETTNMLILTQREDFDIQARYANSVVNVNAPSGYAFVGGENSQHGLNINTLAAAGEVRLKVNGSIRNVRNDNNAVLTSQSAVIESGIGAIGTALNPFRIDIQDNYKITARAEDGIWLEEMTNNMEVGQIYSPNEIRLVSPGAITDFENDLIMDVKGDVVSLIAQNAIGEQYLDADSILVKKQKALDVASVDYDNSTFSVTSASSGAWLYGPLGQNIRMTNADLYDDLDVAVGANLKAQGSFETRGGDVNFRSYESMQLDGDGGINTNGAVLNLITGDNLTIVGNITTGGGAINATVGDNMTVAADATILTSGGDFTAYADGLLNQNITIEDNGTHAGLIDVASGSIRLSASDTISVTGLRTTSGAACADNQLGCAVTVMATNIQDAGDVRSDMIVDGNGDIRLQAHQYINVNDIDYNGSNALQLDITGKNDGARGVATVLGVNAEAGINLERLYMNSATIRAPLTQPAPGTPVFTVTDGRIRDNAYFDIGAAGGTEFLARIGRLENNVMDFDSWLLAGTEAGYFDNAALAPQLNREDDYRCTGAPSFLGDANAVLSFSFLFNRPAVDCSAVLAYYSQSYELATPVRTVEQEVLTVVADIIRRNSGAVRLVPVQQSLQAGSGLVIGSPATSALASRRLSITRGAPQELLVEPLQLAPQTGLSADRLSLPQALDIGTIDQGSDGFIDIVDPATINLDALPTFGALPQDDDTDDAASVQTIEATPVDQAQNSEEGPEQDPQLSDATDLPMGIGPSLDSLMGPGLLSMNLR
ncbi:hemolysin-type calcium-binding region [SAR116 cluster alpha proteobacterium HIMB100]|nr:hemolysin-type calcium-binding region [SAR116 cluster alpha proteobacterium HIMB100]